MSPASLSYSRSVCGADSEWAVIAISYRSARTPKIKSPLGMCTVRCRPMPCNCSRRVVMMMIQSGLLGARLKAPPLALSPTSPMGLDLKQLSSLYFAISCLFVSWCGQSNTEACLLFRAILLFCFFFPFQTSFLILHTFFTTESLSNSLT